MPVIQVIEKKPLRFCCYMQQFLFVKPHYLYKETGGIVHAAVKGSTLGWYIGNHFISYQQLKSAAVSSPIAIGLPSDV
jgi:hypothetical protein